jgi:hypothetical protein
MPSIRALTNEASALLAQKHSEREAALCHLHLARQLWTSIDSRFHAAGLRLLIAALQLELDDSSGATTEISAACAAAEDLDSDKLRLACRALLSRIAA